MGSPGLRQRAAPENFCDATRMRRRLRACALVTGLVRDGRSLGGGRDGPLTPEKERESHDSDQIDLVQSSFAKVAPIADTAAVDLLRPPVRNRARGQAALSRRHGRAAPQADDDARRRRQRVEGLSTRSFRRCETLAVKHVGYGVKADALCACRRGLDLGSGARPRRGLHRARSRAPGSRPMARSPSVMIAAAYGKQDAA